MKTLEEFRFENIEPTEHDTSFHRDYKKLQN